MGEPWITIFSRIQRPIQTVLRPAVWIPGLRNLHSKRETLKRKSTHFVSPPLYRQWSPDKINLSGPNGKSLFYPRWTFENATHQSNLDSILNAINKVISKDKSKFYWQVQPMNESEAGNKNSEKQALTDAKSFVRIFTFTRAEWLDITEITLKGDKAEVWAFSSGFLPLMIPFACFLNVPLFWVPFLDMGLNEKRLERIVAEMDKLVVRS